MAREVQRIRWSSSVNVGTAVVAGETVDFDATDAEMETALETGLGVGVGVTLDPTTGGFRTYTITYDAHGPQADITCDFSGLLISSARTPSVTETTPGVDFVAATSASVTVTASGADDTTTDTIGNSVSHDGGGSYSGSAAAAGWTAQPPSGSSVEFIKDDPGEQDLSGYGVASGAGSANVNSEGTNEVTAVQEVQDIDFSGAASEDPNFGTCDFAGQTINYDDSGAVFETALEAGLGVGVAVAGSFTPFTVTWDDAGARSLIPVSNNTFAYRTATGVNATFATITEGSSASGLLPVMQNHGALSGGCL